ncbi:hypothetical protein [Halocella sp. SP3-1]|uniref:hypothetical protein n=1 Tax=Halocella sp. SP3-1 TaxID=2382161 RepID=UPI000F754D4B|nr:hypothetical protein [Halocella sp. SP3-1]AZO93557.1 hypothetical protein D7D81_02505 [Halocella sp. SP3-1]
MTIETQYGNIINSKTKLKSTGISIDAIALETQYGNIINSTSKLKSTGISIDAIALETQYGQTKKMNNYFFFGNSYLNNIASDIEQLNYQNPPLITFDNNNFKYGTFNNTKVNNKQLELAKTRENVTTDVLAGYQTTQEGWSYGYGYEIDVIESVVIKDIEVLYTTELTMNMKVCIFEQTENGWEKINETIEQNPQLTEGWAKVSGVNTTLLAGNTYRIVHYSRYSRDIHWVDKDIHPLATSFGQTSKSVSDSSQYKAEGVFSTHTDKNVYMRLNVDGVYTTSGSYETEWAFVGFNPVFNVLKIVPNLPDVSSGTITIQTSDDRITINDEKTFNLVDHDTSYAYDITDILSGESIKIIINYNTRDTSYSPQLSSFSVYGSADPNIIVTSYTDKFGGKAFTAPRIVSSNVNKIDGDLRYDYFKETIERKINSHVNNISSSTKKETAQLVKSYLNSIDSETNREKVVKILESYLKNIDSNVTAEGARIVKSHLNIIDSEAKKAVEKTVESYISKMNTEIRPEYEFSSVDKIISKVATNPAIVRSHMRRIESKPMQIVTVTSHINNIQNPTIITEQAQRVTSTLNIGFNTTQKRTVTINSYLKIKSEPGRITSIKVDSYLNPVNTEISKELLTILESGIQSINSVSERAGSGERSRTSFHRIIVGTFIDYEGHGLGTGIIKPASITKGEFIAKGIGLAEFDGKIAGELLMKGRYYSK